MPKRKHIEIEYSHSYFTRQRKAYIQLRFISNGKDALPIVASTLDNESMSSFATTNRLFYNSANRHFRKQIFQYIASNSEIELSKEIVQIINNLKYPRQVIALLNLRSQIFPYQYSFESDLLTEYNNPACWYLLDDNLQSFLQTFDHPDDARIFLPLALACARFQISQYLMRFAKGENYQFRASLYQRAVSSGHVEMLSLVNFTDQYNGLGQKLNVNETVRLAIISGSLEMVTTVLANHDVQEYINGEDAGLWDERMLGFAMESGNVKLFIFLSEFIREHSIPHTPQFLCLSDATRSGNLKMINYTLDWLNGAYSREDHEIKFELEAAAAQRPEVFEFIKTTIEKEIDKKVFIHDACLIKSIENAQLGTFAIMLSLRAQKSFTFEMLDSLFNAAIKTANVIVINYILNLAKQEKYSIPITQQHLLVAAQTNAETYAKIANLAKQSQAQPKPIPNNAILKEAFHSYSSLLVHEVLEHAKSCNIELKIYPFLIEKALQEGCVRIFTRFGTQYATKDNNRIHLQTWSQTITSNPFTHKVFEDHLFSSAASAMQLT